MNVNQDVLKTFGHWILTGGVIIHPQPHVDGVFPHLGAVIKDKLILLGALDAQKLLKKAMYSMRILFSFCEK